MALIIDLEAFMPSNKYKAGTFQKSYFNSALIDYER